MSEQTLFLEAWQRELDSSWREASSDWLDEFIACLGRDISTGEVPEEIRRQPSAARIDREIQPATW